MNFFFSLILLILFFIKIKSVDIEYCIDSDHHKKEPSKENSLHNQCKPWEQYSCCNERTTIRAHETTNHYKFNYNHCSDHQLSDKCKKHFIQDLCFYECEPNLKPWVVKVVRSFARERISMVPICATDCDKWWNDCMDDYTCADNWAKGFKWMNGTNECPQSSQCKPIREMFSNSQQFCEMIWDNSWKYTTEDKPCMRMWFNGPLNPNKEIAEYYSSARGSGDSLQTNLYIISFAIIFTFIENVNKFC